MSDRDTQISMPDITTGIEELYEKAVRQSTGATAKK